MLWNPRTFWCHANIPKFLHEVTLQILDFLKEMFFRLQILQSQEKHQSPKSVTKDTRSV